MTRERWLESAIRNHFEDCEKQGWPIPPILRELYDELPSLGRWGRFAHWVGRQFTYRRYWR